MKKLVLFGAGKIGLSFIGQLFARSGYEVVFIDLAGPVISELNRRNEYEVIIKSDKPDTVLKIKNVRGILGIEKDKIAEELSDADIAAVSVGQNGFQKAIENIAPGLIMRKKKSGNRPLDIILAENLHNAGQLAKSILSEIMGRDYPIDDLVGLIETSIGKMVPIMPLEVQKEDPLLVYAEPYNSLILDKKAFKNPIPEIDGLAPKENIKAWVDRKSHIHNFGHVAAAYKGFLTDPSIIYLADILEISSVKRFTRSAMLESAEILMKKYPGEFTYDDLTYHIDDLLYRFGNRTLGDTVFRVGCDLKRKLHKNDRVLGPFTDGILTRSRVDKILSTFINGLHFGACDENGNQFPGDAEFSESVHKKGLKYVLCNICGLKEADDAGVIEMILSSSATLFHQT